ncbi:MAG: hypothetical protein RLZZ528_1097 [Pseudomonadota bacterium]|jgi:hypothetical protein
MKTVIAIRTHRWGPEEDRLAKALSGVRNAEVVVAFQNRPEGVEPPLPVVDVSDAFLAAAGLAAVPDWGWRCGDYSLYALRGARPDADFYWLIEPDVFFTSDPQGFFALFEGDGSDALGYRLEPYGRDMRFSRQLKGLPVMRAIFAMTRFSGAAIDHVFALRREAGQGPVSARYFPNDELFVFTHVAANPSLTSGRLEDRAPGWFADIQFDTDPDLLLDLVQESAPPGRVLHPVRGRASFVGALTGRISRTTTVLSAYREALRALTEDEAEAVVKGVEDRLRGEIRRIRLARRERRAKRLARRAQ